MPVEIRIQPNTPVAEGRNEQAKKNAPIVEMNAELQRLGVSQGAITGFMSGYFRMSGDVRDEYLHTVRSVLTDANKANVADKDAVLASLEKLSGIGGQMPKQAARAFSDIEVMFANVPNPQVLDRACGVLMDRYNFVKGKEGNEFSATVNLEAGAHMLWAKAKLPKGKGFEKEMNEAIDVWEKGTQELKAMPPAVLLNALREEETGAAAEMRAGVSRLTDATQDLRQAGLNDQEIESFTRAYTKLEESGRGGVLYDALKNSIEFCKKGELGEQAIHDVFETVSKLNGMFLVAPGSIEPKQLYLETLNLLKLTGDPQLLGRAVNDMNFEFEIEYRASRNADGAVEAGLSEARLLEVLFKEGGAKAVAEHLADKEANQPFVLSQLSLMEAPA